VVDVDEPGVNVVVGFSVVDVVDVDVVVGVSQPDTKRSIAPPPVPDGRPTVYPSILNGS
jgi:hypothetical protein